MTTGTITSLPPLVEQPPGQSSSNPAGLPGVTYTVAVLNIAQTWTAKQTFPLGNISLNAADVLGLAASLPTSTLPKEVISWTVPGSPLSNWNIANVDGTAVSTAGTTTQGIQEAVNASLTGLGTAAGDLAIKGGDNATGGAQTVQLSTTLNFPATQGKRVEIGSVTLNSNSGVGATPGINFDSQEMMEFSLKGGQHVYQGTVAGTGIRFKPVNGTPLDLLHGIVDSSFTFTAPSSIAFDWSGNAGAFANSNYFDFGELNYSNCQNGTAAGGPFFVPSVAGGQNFAYNMFRSRHVHGVIGTGTAWRVGNGAPAGGQDFGKNMYQLNINADSSTSSNGIDTYESNSFYLVNISGITGGVPIRLRPGANNNIIINPYNSAPANNVDGGTGNIIWGGGQIKLGGGASIFGGASTSVTAATFVAGVQGSVQGSIQIAWAGGAGTATITSASNGGNPIIQTPNSSGTMAVSASAPLSLNSGTGNLTISNIGNSSLTNSSLTYGTTAVALGASSTVIDGLTRVNLTSGNNINWNSDTYIGRAGAAKLMLGQADAASPVAQTLSVQNVVAGTSNTAGAGFVVAGSQSTGTGLGGAVILQVAAPGTTGTAQNALVEGARLQPSATAPGGMVWTQGVGGAFTPWIGSVAEWRTGTDQRFSLGAKNLLSTGVAFQVFNDAINANLGLEFRASVTAFTQGGVSIGNSAAGIDPGVGSLNVAGHIASGAPTTKTTNYSLVAADSSLIFNGAGSITLTLQSAASYSGRWLYLKTIAAQTVVSASSNVVPLVGGVAGTAILAATAGKWAWLQSDGTNWVIMASN